MASDIFWSDNMSICLLNFMIVMLEYYSTRPVITDSKYKKLLLWTNFLGWITPYLQILYGSGCFLVTNH